MSKIFLQKYNFQLKMVEQIEVRIHLVTSERIFFKFIPILPIMSNIVHISKKQKTSLTIF